MNAYIRILATIAALSSTTVLAQSENGYKSKECTVTIGGCDWLFVNNTGINATLTDGDGNFTARPSHIEVKNFGKYPCRVSGTQIGHDFEVGPKEEKRVYLPIYTPKGKPLQSVRATFTFKDSDSTPPKPTPNPNANRIRQLRQTLAQKQNELDAVVRLHQSVQRLYNMNSRAPEIREAMQHADHALRTAQEEVANVEGQLQRLTAGSSTGSTGRSSLSDAVTAEAFEVPDNRSFEKEYKQMRDASRAGY